MIANRITLDGTPRFAASQNVASDLRLFCLPMSFKKDLGLYGVKCYKTLLLLS